MKIVDVLAARSFKDQERIITQVSSQPSLLLFPIGRQFGLIVTPFVPPRLHLQGDEADCFYIVESGQVKIMIKSKVRKVSGLGSFRSVASSALTQLPAQIPASCF